MRRARPVRRWPGGGVDGALLLADPDWRDLHAAPPASAPEARSDAGRLTLDSDVIRAARLLPKNLAHGSLEPLRASSSGCSTSRTVRTRASLKLPESLCPKFAGRYRTYAGDLAAQTQVCRACAWPAKRTLSRAEAPGKPRSQTRWLLAGRETKAETSRAVEVWWADPVGDQQNHAPKTDGDWDRDRPGRPKPAHPRADDSVGAVVAHVRREADLGFSCACTRRKDLKRAGDGQRAGPVAAARARRH